MTEETKTGKQKCGGKGKAMFAYGLIQLSSNLVSAIALAAIALGAFLVAAAVVAAAAAHNPESG